MLDHQINRFWENGLDWAGPRTFQHLLIYSPITCMSISGANQPFSLHIYRMLKKNHGALSLKLVTLLSS